MLRGSQILFLTSAIVAMQSALADERLPSYLIRLPESVATVFVAETSTAAFHRYDRHGDSITSAGSRYMSIGQDGAGKQRSGDRRTPLGIYFVTEELDTSRLHEKYGVTAYPLDYPNAWDRRLERTGDGIWVHGVDRRGGRRPELDTDGCIALPNDDLAALADQFKENSTPVLITREIAWSDAERVAAHRDKLERAVRLWADSIESGDMYTYLSLYDDDFVHWEMSKPEWSSFSLQTIGVRPIQDVTVDDLLLLGYPEEEGLYLSRFRQTIIEDDIKTAVMKRIYWRADDDGVLKIIAEDSG